MIHFFDNFKPVSPVADALIRRIIPNSWTESSGSGSSVHKNATLMAGSCYTFVERTPNPFCSQRPRMDHSGERVHDFRRVDGISS